ncbi:hypothetical protein NPIL_478151 [Nephila pilipes]|uniref:Uncharacterized protein n=1 Tax=Nephila pilipes TaxID=299642 RepID=A0A8X6PS26_NEPPI|nr:hypothetical protein NPIL_478151 [Nephila pilipes]
MIIHVHFGLNSLPQWLSGRHYPPCLGLTTWFIRQVEIFRTKFLKPTGYSRICSLLNVKHTIDIDDCLPCCGSTMELILHQHTNFADFHGLT